MMKSISNNICKFVSYETDTQITTNSFVYETKSKSYEKIEKKNNHAIHLIISGSGRLHTEHRIYDLQSGAIFFTFADVPCFIENTGDIQYMYITFHGRRSEELFDKFHISPFNCVFKGYEGLLPLWQNSLGKANEENLDLISEGILLYTFSQLSNILHDKENHLIADILKHIELNFSDSTLSLDSTAKEFGYNSKYISRIFKENIGITFSEYLKNTRIQHATFLIEHGITIIKNVALLSGYSDSLYFSKVFKQAVGVSPKEFIARKNIDS